MNKKIISFVLCFGMIAACFFSPIVSKADTIQAALTNIELNKTKITIGVGKSTTLTAKLYPTSSQNVIPITFTTSNEKIKLFRKSKSTVTVTGKKAGQATVYVSARATGSNVTITKKCKVYITDGKTVAPKSVTISSSSKTTSKTTYIGNSCTLKATVLPSNATNKKIIWSTSNANIATIDADGKVRGKTPGTVTITATVSGTSVKGTYKIIVKRKKLQLADTKLDLVVGDSQKIRIKTLAPASSKLVWRSSNPSVATVSDNGTVKALKEGQATIRACIYGESVQKKCVVTVTKPNEDTTKTENDAENETAETDKTAAAEAVLFDVSAN